MMSPIVVVLFMALFVVAPASAITECEFNGGECRPFGQNQPCLPGSKQCPQYSCELLGVMCCCPFYRPWQQE